MPNSYYNVSGNPVTASPGASLPMRSEFSGIAAGFAKLPDLTAGPANQVVVVNGAGTALISILGLANSFLANMAAKTVKGNASALSDVVADLTMAQLLDMLGAQNPISWTPNLQFGAAQVGITYSQQIGTYLQIGRFAIVEGTVTLTSKGSSVGGATISNLPINGSGLVGLIGVPYYANMAGLTTIGGYINTGSSIFQFTNSGATAHVGLTNANFTNTSQFYFVAVYITA